MKETHVAYCYNEDGVATWIKASDDRDCLPPNAGKVVSVPWITFEELHELLDNLHLTTGVEYCIDYGEQFVERES